MTTCIVQGCERERRGSDRSGDGITVHATCAEHERQLLTGAFGWHSDARAGRLRPAVVGGVPISTPNQGPGAEPSGLPAIKRADALAGCSSDGGSPETERAIARATPGPAFDSRDAGERLTVHPGQTLPRTSAVRTP